MANLWSICPRHTGFGLAKREWRAASAAQHGIIILMNSFFILTEFPSYDVAQGLIGKPERKGSPNQISFSLVDTDDKDTFITFCY